ncbi:MAG TPA: hypothetical protein VFW66_07490 [Gemmatimonadales bacterium]|nr:hypothetical protein [Gemmatimonadales bacterium]
MGDDFWGTPPDDARELDRLLGSLRFHARESIEPELAGQASAEHAPPADADHARHAHASRATRAGTGSMRLPRRVGAALGHPGRRTIVCAAAACAVVAAGWIGWRAAVATVTVDWCCGDLDGGGSVDDGVVVVARKDESIRRLAVYEDRDRSHTFSKPDVVRFERGAALTVARALPSRSVTLRHCCADYDGAGPADDGIVVVGVPPDRVLLVGLYDQRRADPHGRVMLR